VVNDNAPGQVVLSGGLEALDRTEAEVTSGTRDPARRRRRLPLARDGAERAPSGRARRRQVNDAAFTVFSGASARPFEDVRAELANALVKPVRWRETVIAMHEAGAPSFVEVGPGKVLARMGKRILKGVPFETPAEGLVHA
jgi:malonyl CoA-acyl carrier protein transacylase